MRCLASAACGCPSDGILIGEGAVVRVSAPEADAARALLLDLMRACGEGLRGHEPLPTAVKTGCAWLDQPAKAAAVFEGQFNSPLPGEGKEACLARLFPDFASLQAQPRFAVASRRLYQPFLEWLDRHVSVQLLEPDPAAPDATDV